MVDFYESFENPDLTYKTLDTTAVTWMTVFNFSPNEVPIADGQKAYQLKGHAKYVEIAKRFGWQVLNDFWYSLNEDYENGVASDTSTDGQILRFSQKAGFDLRPLFHFWGKQPSINGYWTEKEHARQWDDEILWDPQMLPNGEIFDESSCARIKAVVDGLVDLYFPNGRP